MTRSRAGIFGSERSIPLGAEDFMPLEFFKPAFAALKIRTLPTGRVRILPCDYRLEKPNQHKIFSSERYRIKPVRCEIVGFIFP
jgi:hypothetical protein